MLHIYLQMAAVVFVSRSIASSTQTTIEKKNPKTKYRYWRCTACSRYCLACNRAGSVTCGAASLVVRGCSRCVLVSRCGFAESIAR
ncbi:hypothetical protein DFH27DRAFT_48853 [Peziza echinospora]|nr:hypothetical protein DFH27DRAFT_48853 [Peziza echinospora]